MNPEAHQNQPLLAQDSNSPATGDRENPVKHEDNDSSTNRVVVQKLNRRIFSICCGIILFSYMDRGNLGLAANDVCEDRKLSHKEYGTGVSLFYIGYASSPLLSNVLLKRFGAPTWLASILGGWGIIAAGFAFMNAAWQFYVLRLLLGIAEGGTFPGIWYYATMFYPDEYLIQPYGLVMVATYLSLPVSSVVAAALLQLDGVGDIEGWRYLFFIEGVVPFLYSIFVYLALPKSIEDASFLNAEEKNCLISHKGSEVEQKLQEVSFWQEFQVVLNTKVFWIWTLSNTLGMAVFHCLCSWITLLINDMLDDEEDDDDDEDETCGSSSKHKTLAVLLTAIPFLLGAALCFYLKDWLLHVKSTERFYRTVVFLSGVALSTWIGTKQVGFAFGFISLVVSLSIYVLALSVLFTHIAKLFDQSARSVALAAFNMTGMFGPIVAPPLLGIVVDAKGYSLGIPLLSALFFLSTAVTLCIPEAKPQENNEVDNT